MSMARMILKWCFGHATMTTKEREKISRLNMIGHEMDWTCILVHSCPVIICFHSQIDESYCLDPDFSWLSRAQVRYLPRWCVQIFIVTWYRTYHTRSCTYVYPYSVPANCIMSVCNYWLVPSIIDDAVTVAVALNRTPERLTTNGAFKLWFRDGSIPDSARVSRSLRLYEMQIWQVGNLFGLATCTCRAANKNWRHWLS